MKNVNIKGWKTCTFRHKVNTYFLWPYQGYTSSGDDEKLPLKAI